MRPPVRADAAMRCSVPYDRDSLAGAAISACRIQSRHRRLCARGRAAKRCGSVETMCHWFASGLAILLSRFDFGLCPRWHYVAALPSIRARLCDSVAAFCLRSRLLFAALRQTGRLAISCVSIPPGRDRHSCVLAALVRLSALAGSLRVWPFIRGDPDGGTGDTRNEVRGTGKQGWRRSLCALLRGRIGLVMLSAGERWG